LIQAVALPKKKNAAIQNIWRRRVNNTVFLTSNLSCCVAVNVNSSYVSLWLTSEQ